jgi:hypothetical protein
VNNELERICKELVMGILMYEGVSKKVSGLATWSKNCKWYSSLPLDAVISLFCESV